MEPYYTFGEVVYSILKNVVNFFVLTISVFLCDGTILPWLKLKQIILLYCISSKHDI